MKFEQPQEVNKKESIAEPSVEAKDLESGGDQAERNRPKEIYEKLRAKDAEKLAEIRKSLGLKDWESSEALEKEEAKENLQKFFDSLNNNEYGLKVKAGVSMLLGGIADKYGNISLKEGYAHFLNRRSLDPKTGHVDAVGGPKNPDMSEWLKFNEQAVSTLRQIIEGSLISSDKKKIGDHLTAAEAKEVWEKARGF